MSDQITQVRKYNAFGGRAGKYGFALFRDDGGVFKPLDQSSSIVLRMNPSSLDMDEPFATEFQPTLGGMYVESRGHLWRDCTISGTTGFAPFLQQTPMENQASRMSRIANHSGYKDFLELRNLFRRYAMVKNGDKNSPDGWIAQDPAARKSVVMVFMNYKDNEFWLAEPLTFVMPPRRALSYHYNIRLRLTDPFQRANLPGDLYGAWYNNDPPFGLGAIGDILATVGDVTQMAVDTITFINSTKALVFGMPALVQAYAKSISDVYIGLTEYAKTLVMPPYCTSNGITDAAAAALGLYNSASLLGVGSGPAGLQFMSSLLTLSNTLYTIGADASPFATSLPNRYMDLQDTQVSRSGRTQAPPPRPPSGYMPERVMQDETIFDLTRRTIGDVTRYSEIIVLNNLVPPYLANTASERRPGVLIPGDTILVPSGSTASTQSFGLSDDFQAPQLTGTMTAPEMVDGYWMVRVAPPTFAQQSTTRWTTNQWERFRVTVTDANDTVYVTYVVQSTAHTLQIEPAIGVVFPATWSIQVPSADSNILEDNASYGVDLMRTPTKDIDFQLISGLSNFDQAIEVKLDTEAGTLPMHQWFGLAADIGEKTTELSVMNSSLNATRTFLSDSRVATVSNVEVDITDDTMTLRAEVQPRADNRIRVYQRGI